MKLRLTQQSIICRRLSRLPQGNHKKNVNDSKRGVALKRKSYVIKKKIITVSFAIWFSIGAEGAVGWSSSMVLNSSSCGGRADRVELDSERSFFALSRKGSPNVNQFIKWSCLSFFIFCHLVITERLPYSLVSPLLYLAQKTKLTVYNYMKTRLRIWGLLGKNSLNPGHPRSLFQGKGSQHSFLGEVYPTISHKDFGQSFLIKERYN